MIARLDHPGIVPVHDVGFDLEGRPYFTMRYVDGLDLDAVFDRARADQEYLDSLAQPTRNFVLSVSGVSIDEESINLIQYQRAFEAAARVISIADEVYVSLINILG